MTRRLKVLDLFGGLGGWSQAFLDRGHTVRRIDNDPRFSDVPFTYIQDVLAIDTDEFYWSAADIDVVLASPPCQAFSLAASGTHMRALAVCGSCGAHAEKRSEKWLCVCGVPRVDEKKLWLEPRTEFGKLSVRLVEKTLDIIREVQPKFWWMENPNGGMIHFVPDSIPRVQVTYCRYGESRMKLTNLWGEWPGEWQLMHDADFPKPTWVNTGRWGWQPRAKCVNGHPDHTRSKRGDKTGTQGIKGAAARALVPYQLSEEVCVAVEEAIGGDG